ncbi:MAG: CTP synthase [Bacteroidota bacterium]
MAPPQQPPLDAESIYEVPLLLREQKLDEVVLDHLHLPDALSADPTPDLSDWVDFLRRLKNPEGKVIIALVGKYVEHQDAYKSISESFLLAGARNGVQVSVRSVLSDDVTDANVADNLEGVSGVLVAPGFGDRGIDGKIEAVRWARESGVPFLGICLGMQVATVEFARNVAGLAEAHSTEFEPDNAFPVISMMAEQKTVTDKGGTMRLGAYTCALTEGSLAAEVYGGAETVQERHRHRFEVNNDLRYRLREAGLVFSGVNPDQDLVEIIELPRPSEGDGAAASPTHPWFVGVQFHPEYRSRVREPHPLFVQFVAAAVAHARTDGPLAEAVGPTRTRKVRRATARVLAEG